MTVATKKRISKSTLSMFLRTKCDRELYLSLHEDSELDAHDMPVPLQARPGIGVLQTAGREFEDERNEQLIQAFGSRVVFQPDKAGTNKPVKAPLAELLGKVTSTPSFVLQGKFELTAFQNTVMAKIGLNPTHVTLVPPIAGLIPDIIVVRDPADGDEEISADGCRKPIDFGNDTRLALSIIDVKHTSEANPSYSAEVALYALFLANWIADQELTDKYFVTVRSYLWTRFKQGQSELDRLMNARTAATPNQYLDALLADSEDANLRFYLSTVLHFFRDDILRVIDIGDACKDGWQNLEWHVDGRCSACDWLGHEKWATLKDKARIAEHPTHYCYPAAKLTGHLSQIAGMTRGARKTLQLNAIQDTFSAAKASSVHPVFQQHSHLKKERSRIPLRAQSLISATTSIDNAAILASLAPAPQLHVAITVNFDPSAGILTGLSIFGRATAYVSGQTPRQFPSRSFIVDQKSLTDEWVALEGLLSTLSDIIEQSEKFIIAAGKTPLTAQIAFWERRQFEELCAAMGRHLPKVLSLKDRKTKALAWLFPADELIEKPDGAVSPCVVFVDEIVRRVVFAPTPHVITLFDTVESYFSGTVPVKLTDSYYREFLTNGIPRERIYEIWSNSSSIKRGTVTVPRNTVIQEFGNALEKQCRALNSIIEKLRSDFKGQLKANAPKLSLSIPSGARGVAFDSKLWVWWDELQYQTNKLEGHQRLALDAETLEASYEAIRLTNGQQTAVPGEFIYDVLSGSTEAKLDDNDGFLALGKDGLPGFSLQRARDIIRPFAPTYPGQDQNLILPLWSSLSVTLVSFDRTARKAIVRLSNWRDNQFIPYLLANSTTDLMNDIFITKGQSTFKWHEKSAQILLQVGNPSIAVADRNAANAMGMVKIPSPGSDSITPIARVLWDAFNLHSLSVIPTPKALSIAAYAETKHNLNNSQRDAVAHAAEKGLTVIWGPPGTGKTQTLAGCVHGLVHDAAMNNQPLNVLVAGPTYKAVEELIGRVVTSLDQDVTCRAEIFVGYSASQNPKVFTTSGKHLRIESFNLNPEGQETRDCLSSLGRTDVLTIIATTTMQSYKLAYWMFGHNVGPVFDVVIIDESSQVQVTTSLSPLATLKDDFRLIIAGDHLQMPPIMALEPPVEAEYLVGSIQKYVLARPFDGQVKTCPLEENYRSTEDIVAYARSIGYRATLKAANPLTSLHLLSPVPLPTSGFPASLPWSDFWPAVIDPVKKVLTLLHDDDLSSQSNAFEAKIVAALVWCLRGTVSAELSGRGISEHVPPTPQQFWSECIGIVTPHRAQRALVVRELKEIFPTDPYNLIDMAVDTVEKFQGGQRHTIIVTFGVGDADIIMGEEAFLMQLERTNVAISRAMAKCLVIMPLTLAGHVPQDKKALKTAHAIKDYVEEFCNVEERGVVSLGGNDRHARLRFRQ
ncbi:AAA domain-containing protein [Methylobacter tundripaludum]|uniref:AAA domain-containing protein n=1 Tax=Methylobacter tundripaludum TaxID=173365 RepID=A0A2S6H541_9GAMM|nr:AAA domain-containing protein [Methylobacter tundripaludum]PPK72540.1 AAA domain-containing protein [Methylobacter tundripaludum]